MLKLVLVTMLVIISLTLEAQTPGLANKPAPLPSQITTAKRVFVSNAGGEFEPARWSGDSTRTYNEFYAAIKAWGRYEVVLAPADADLVLQISFAEPIVDVNVFGASGGTTTGSSSIDPQFRLILLDPKTDVLLWTIKEHVPQKIALKKSRDKVFDEALESVVDDLKKLTAEPPLAP